MSKDDARADPSEPVHLGRRKLLRALGLGGGAAVALSSRWAKPLVDSVVVPAHAQASPPPTT